MLPCLIWFQHHLCAVRCGQNRVLSCRHYGGNLGLAISSRLHPEYLPVPVPAISQTHKSLDCQDFFLKTKTKTKTLGLKTKTKTKTLFFFVLEAPQDQDFGLEDYITAFHCTHHMSGSVIIAHHHAMHDQSISQSISLSTNSPFLMSFCLRVVPRLWNATLWYICLHYSVLCLRVVPRFRLLMNIR